MDEKVIQIYAPAIEPLKLQNVDCIEMVRFLLDSYDVKPAIWIDDENYLIVDKYQMQRWAKQQCEMPLKTTGLSQTYEFDPVSKILFIGSTY